MLRAGEDLFQVEELLWVLNAPTGKGIYDFGFDRFFACRRPYQLPDSLEVVARVGVWNDYAERYRELAAEGVKLVHSPEQHLLATELPHWYPRLTDLTPRSVWYDTRPSAKTVEDTLGWPVFVKGERQTSRHRKSLSIIEGPEQFERAMATYATDPILHWQRVVCRELRPLRRVEEGAPDRIPSSFEFRTFWWRGELVGWGPYWWQGTPYTMNEAEQREALGLGREVARRMDVPFLVVDLAQEVSGRWIVIECNDGQESGYAGISPFALWRNILELQRAR
ncbi:ATP-grasp domain-containing protein [Myxococcus qinghaiensis]|uniref:ATP-grasp domain-containing protein n=1 Tax=Myxococcus qinghaiensis TaxID=2906758 RepID=UPI0020A80C7D|nr:ATP-grasp domain-containing protein [Myxococcus qinghaiensis]MCP3164662.1 ATP-grasp domain-containing protein [Myxococcus qinghaiensis]